MRTQRRALAIVLTCMSMLGMVLVVNAVRLLVTHAGIIHFGLIMELVAIGLVVTPWSVRMPSGASWRPGIPLMMMSIFLMRPSFVVLVPIAGLLLITARAHAPWWKYFETLSHVGIGLYFGALTFHWLNPIFQPLLFGRTLAVIIALAVHLFFNRLISAVIVAQRERRTLRAQIRATLRELHWGYLNAYILITMASMFDPTYLPIGVLLTAILQAGIFLAVSNYSDHKTLQKSAWTDGLTSLENRTAWEALLEDPKHHAVYGNGTSLYVVDLDNFKDINDRYGHLAGDQVLRIVAKVLQDSFPEPARLFRIGGDEFVVLSPRKPRDEQVVAHIREQIGSRLSHYPEIEIPVNISMGEATAPDDGHRLQDLFEVSDRRMYEYKRRTLYTESGLDFGLPASVLSLILAIESRDTYTSGHNLRVAYYAWRLASHLGLPAGQVQSLFRAGLVHDVGKIGVPDAILNKPGTLTHEEYLVIQQHPVTGYEMCSKLGFSQEELDVIRYHHERWDGQGYPSGLAGEDIPLLARIAAVADVYDAVTSSRSYRGAWSHQQAMEYLKNNRGTQFDLACVNAWIELNEPELQTDAYVQWAKESHIADGVSAVHAI